MVGPDKGMYGDLLDEARGEWRTALDEVAPKKPFGPDYRKTLKAIEGDPRIAQKVVEWRRFQHQVNGLDYQTAERQAMQEVEDFRRTFGGE